MSTETFETYVVAGYVDQGFVTEVNTLAVDAQSGQSTVTSTVYIQKPVQELETTDATVNGLAEREATAPSGIAIASDSIVVSTGVVSRQPISADLTTTPVIVTGVVERELAAGSEIIDLDFDVTISGNQGGGGAIRDVISTSSDTFVAIQGGSNVLFQVFKSTDGSSWVGSRPTGVTDVDKLGQVHALAQVSTDTFVVLGGGNSNNSDKGVCGARIFITTDNFSTVSSIDLDTVLAGVGEGNGYVDSYSKALKLSSVAVGGGKVVVTGNFGIVLVASTSDLTSWTLVDTPAWSPALPINASQQMYVAYGDGRFVIVAQRYRTAYSTNGTSWTVGVESTENPSGASQPRNITYGNPDEGDGYFLVVGTASGIVKTTDGSSVTYVQDPTGDANLRHAEMNPATGNWVVVGNDGAIYKGRDDATTWTYQSSGDAEIPNNELRSIHSVAFVEDTWVITGGGALIAFASIATYANDVYLFNYPSSVNMDVKIIRAPVNAVIEAEDADVVAVIDRSVFDGETDVTSQDSIVVGAAERQIVQVGRADLKPTDNNILQGSIEREVIAAVALKPTENNIVAGVAERSLNNDGITNSLESGSSTLVASAERVIRTSIVIKASESIVDDGGTKRTVIDIDATPHADNSTLSVEAQLSFLLRLALKAQDATVDAQVSRTYAGVDIALVSQDVSVEGTVKISRKPIVASIESQSSTTNSVGIRTINDIDATPKSGEASINQGDASRIITANGELSMFPAFVDADGTAEREIITSDGTVEASSSIVSGVAENAITGVGAIASGDSQVGQRAERVITDVDASVQSFSSSASGIAERTVDTKNKVQRLESGDASVTGEGNLGYDAFSQNLRSSVSLVSGLGVRGSNSLVSDLESSDADVIGSGIRAANGLGVLVSEESSASGIAERAINAIGTLVSGQSSTTGLAENTLTGTGNLTSSSSTIVGVSERTTNSVSTALASGNSSTDGLAERTIVRIPNVWNVFLGPIAFTDPGSSSKTFQYKAPSPSPVNAPKFVVSGQTGARSKYNGEYTVWSDGGVLLDTPSQTSGTGTNGLNASTNQVKVHATTSPYGTSTPAGVSNIYLKETATRYHWIVSALDRNASENTTDDRYQWYCIETSKSIDLRVTSDAVFNQVWTSDVLAFGARDANPANVVDIAPRKLEGFTTLQPGSSSVTAVVGIGANSLESSIESQDASVAAVTERTSNGSGVLVSQDSKTLGFAFGIEIINNGLVNTDSIVTGSGERSVNVLDGGIQAGESTVNAAVETIHNALPPRTLTATDVFVQGVAERQVNVGEIGDITIESDSVIISGVAERIIEDNGVTHAFKPTENNNVSGAAERELRSSAALETTPSTASGVAERTINSTSAVTTTSSTVVGLGDRGIDANQITQQVISGESSVSGVSERTVVEVSSDLVTGSSTVADGGTKIERKPIVAALQNHDSRTVTDPKGVVSRFIDAAVKSGDSRAVGRIVLGSNLREGIAQVDDAVISGVAIRQVDLEETAIESQSSTTPNSFAERIVKESPGSVAQDLVSQPTTIAGVAERQIEESPDDASFNLDASPSSVTGNAERVVTVDAGVSRVDDAHVQATVEYKRVTKVQLVSGDAHTSGFAFGIEDLYETLESGDAVVVGQGVRTSNVLEGTLESQESSTTGVVERSIVNIPDYTFFYTGTIAGLGPKTTGTGFSASYSGTDLVISSPFLYAGTYSQITNDPGYVLTWNGSGFNARQDSSYNRYILNNGNGSWYCIVAWDRTGESPAAGARWLVTELTQDPANWVDGASVSVGGFASYSFVSAPGSLLQISQSADRPVSTVLDTSKVETQSALVTGVAERKIENNSTLQQIISQESKVTGQSKRTVNTNDGIAKGTDSLVGGVAERTIEDNLTVHALKPTDNNIVAGVADRIIEQNEGNAALRPTENNVVSGVAERNVDDNGATHALRPTLNNLVVGAAERVMRSGVVLKPTDNNIVAGLAERTIDDQNKEDLDVHSEPSSVGGIAERIIEINEAPQNLVTTPSISTGVAERIIENNELNQNIESDPSTVAGLAKRTVVDSINNAVFTTPSTVVGLAERTIETNGETQELHDNEFSTAVGLAERQINGMFADLVITDPAKVSGVAERIIREAVALENTDSLVVGIAERLVGIVDDTINSQEAIVTGVAERTIDDEDQENISLEAQPSKIVGLAERTVENNEITQDLVATPSVVVGLAERTVEDNNVTHALVASDSKVVANGQRELDDIEAGGTQLVTTDSIVVGSGIRTANLLQSPASEPSIVVGLAERTVEDNELNHELIASSSSVAGTAEREIVRVPDGAGPLALSPSSNDANVDYNSSDELILTGFSGHLDSYNGKYVQFPATGYAVESGNDYVVYPELFVAGASTPHNAYLKETADEGAYYIVIWNETKQDWYVSYSTGDPRNITAGSTLPLGTLLQSLLAINSELKNSPFKTLPMQPANVVGVSERTINLLQSPVSQESTVTGVAERTVETNEIEQQLVTGDSKTANTAKISRLPIIAAVKSGDSRFIGTGENIVVGLGPQSMESGPSKVVGAGFRTAVEEETPSQAQDSKVTGVAERTVENNELNQAVVSQESKSTGIAERTINGAGSLVATPSVFGTVNGEGDREIDDNEATHPLVSQDSHVSGVAERQIDAEGAIESGDSRVTCQIYQTLGFQEAIPVEQRFKIVKKPLRTILIRRPASGDPK